MAKKKPQLDNRAITDDADLNKGPPGAPPGADGGDDDDDDDDDEDDLDDGAAKSDVSKNDLLKSLAELDATAKAAANGTSPRLRALSAKVARGDSLSKAETAEMASLVKSDTNTTSTKDLFMQDNDLKKGFEASDFLDGLGTKTAEAIDGVRADFQKALAETGEFNLALASSFNALGKVVSLQQDLLKSLVDEVKALRGDVPQQRREPEAPSGNSRVGTKVSDQGPRGNGNKPAPSLSKAEILDTMDGLIEKSEGHSGMVGGIDLVNAIAKYESTDHVSPAVLRLVCVERKIDPKVFGINAEA